VTVTEDVYIVTKDLYFKCNFEKNCSSKKYPENISYYTKIIRNSYYTKIFSRTTFFNTDDDNSKSAY